MKQDLTEHRWKLERTPNATLVIRPQIFKGNRYIDFRLFFRDVDGSLSPTKKGVTVPLSLWPTFAQVVAEVGEALAAGGWLDREDLAP